MSILGFFLFLIVVILVIGLSLVGSVLRFIFGIGRKATNYNQKRSQNSYNPQQSQQTTNRKKIFEEDEGEYVEFEEVKEEDAGNDKQ